MLLYGGKIALKRISLARPAKVARTKIVEWGNAKRGATENDRNEADEINEKINHKTR